MKEILLSLPIVADILGVSKSTVNSWVKNKKISNVKKDKRGKVLIDKQELLKFEQAKFMFENSFKKEDAVKPLKNYKTIELFCGAGGLALGLENAGFENILLNDIDKDSCKTIKKNRPNNNVICEDISKLDFKKYKNKVDLLSGGFPCQAFSYAGRKLGFEDTRGTLFYEFARAVKEVNPKVLLAENVRGLLSHEKGKTLGVISNIIEELGYELVEPEVLKAIFYKVPQKRERLFLVGIRKDFSKYVSYKYPTKNNRIYTLKDALKSGLLYNANVPKSSFQKYPERKKEILSKVPQGGYWRDLPEDLQKEYMKGSFYLGGGKTGMARRLSWDEPSLTLTCAPAMKQTERCHPSQTRPLSVREYARIQTFPDTWEFEGSITSVYRQIGNAVPVNLATAMGKSLVKLLNDIKKSDFKKEKAKINKNGQAIIRY